MSEEIRMFQVGEPFRLFTERRLPGDDGAVMSAEEGNGYFIVLYFTGVTPAELQAFHLGDIEVAVLQETDAMALTIIRFAGTNLMFELSFDPTVYEDERGYQMTLETNIAKLFVIETNNNTIAGMRSANFPMPYVRKMVAAWGAAKDIPDFSDRYQRWVQDLWRRYTTFELWQRATPCGRMGD